MTLSRENPRATLDISAYLPKCFGQIDLYPGDRKFDGHSNPLPHYPDTVLPDHLITGWNGGTACQSPTPTHPATSPAPTRPAISTPPLPGKPSASASASPTVPGTSGGSAPAPGGSTDVATQVGSPSAKLTTDQPAPGLAQTGSNDGQVIATAAGGAALLVIGAGTLAVSRRRTRRH
ncbi:LPXTG cell wall anchor domain-containing protein [Kitasatospora sp. NPDC001159]